MNDKNQIDWSKYRDKDSDVDWSQYADKPTDKSSNDTWSDLYKGLSEAFPNALKSGVNASAALVGRHPFEVNKEQPNPSWPESVGRVAGKIGGYGILGAPFAIGAEALLPGLAGASIGSGLAGASLSEGGAKERLTNGLLSAIIPAAGKGVRTATRLGKSSILSPKPRSAANIIQQGAEQAEREATAPLNFASEEAKKRGISSVKADPAIFDEATRVLPKTEAYSNLVSKARSGDYDSLRELQSDLGRRSRSLAQADSYAERNLGEEVKQTRDNINDAIHEHFTKKGHHDLAYKVKEGMDKYREYMDLYHGKPQISKLVGDDKEVPVNLISLIRKDSKYYDKLRNELPGLKKIIQHKEDKELLSKLGKHAIYKSGLAAAIHSLYPSSTREED